VRKHLTLIVFVTALGVIASGWYAVGGSSGVAATYVGGQLRAEPPGGELAGKPNILVIVTDDQPRDEIADLRQYMPHTVRLMQQGVRYPNGAVTFPLCCPSRASGMSGRYAHNTGVHDLETGGKLDPKTTVQYALQRRDYNTAIVGKYLQGIPNSADAPYFDCSATWLQPNYQHFTANVNGRMEEVDRYSTKYAGDRLRLCLKGFEQSDRRPWYAYWAPHAPHQSPAFRDTAQPERKYRGADVPECAQPGEKELRDKLPYVTGHSPRRAKIRRFCANAERALMTVDDEIARTRQWLRAHDERDTLIVYWSDNGMLNGQHNRIGKSVPYLPSVQVPMFMWWPGPVKAGVDRRLATNVDLAPTILDAAGVRPRTVMDGHTLLGERSRSVQYIESLVEPEEAESMPKWFQLLKPGAWAYIENRLGSGKTFREYYNLRSDPQQHRNLLWGRRTADSPSVGEVRRLHRQLESYRNCRGTVGRGSANPCP